MVRDYEEKYTEVLLLSKFKFPKYQRLQIRYEEKYTEVFLLLSTNT